MAELLGLQKPELYSGHSFRRTSATLLSNSGANIQSVQDHGDWKSMTIATQYCADSDQQKIIRAKVITKTINEGYTPLRKSSVTKAISTQKNQAVKHLTNKNLVNYVASTSKMYIPIQNDHSEGFNNEFSDKHDNLQNDLPNDLSQEFNEDLSNDPSYIPKDISQQLFEEFSIKENILANNQLQNFFNESESTDDCWPEDSLPSDVVLKLVQQFNSPVR